MGIIHETNYKSKSSNSRSLQDINIYSSEENQNKRSMTQWNLFEDDAEAQILKMLQMIDPHKIQRFTFS